LRTRAGPGQTRPASALGARALTAGTDILFRAGEYQPGTPGGDRLLAHELAHVVQQAHGLPQGILDTGATGHLEKAAGLAADHASPAAEHEAHGAALIAAMGKPVPALSRQPPTIARQDDPDDLGTQSGGSVPDLSSDVGLPVNTGTSPPDAGTSPPDAGTSPPDAGTSPPDAGTTDAGAPPFVDSITIRRISEPVPVRVNAVDFVNNSHAKFGPEGGHTEVSGLPFTPSIDAAGNVIAVTVAWVITEHVPSVSPVPGSAITAPGAQAELDACNALASRVGQHEDQHAATEQKLRTGFAKSLRGVKEAVINARLHALECRIGAAQRAFDNIEGVITLDASNHMQVSGVDHPEYVDGCP